MGNENGALHVRRELKPPSANGSDGAESGGTALVAEDVHYFTDQAHKCFRLARLCNDDTVAERLQELGREFARRAIALGADPRLFPRLG